MTPPYSLAVVTWNCEGYLRALVDSMNRHLTGAEELVLVDNDSDNSPEKTVGEWRGPAQFVGLERNIGFGAATNIAVERAEGEAVVMINPDTELIDDSLGALAAAALELNALVGPRVLNSDLTIQPTASGPEVGVWPWVRALLPGALAPPPIRRRTEPYRLHRRTEVTWLTGSCIAGPRDLLVRLGPFDAALHLYGEDTDLGIRADAAGVARWFCPEIARIVHHGEGSSQLAYGEAGGWLRDGAVNWRAALRRAYGPDRERRAVRALKLNLTLRAHSKRLLGRPAGRDQAALDALEAVPAVPELPPNPSG